MTTEHTQYTRPWRALVRITSVDPERDLVRLKLPGWSWRTTVHRKISDFPEAVSKPFTKGYRFHAMVNIGAEHARDLVFYEFVS